jgi:hypothetical protein
VDDRAGMESSARRIKAERNRQRLPYRSAASRWTRRVAGLLATAVFLGIGVASALMILPDDKGGGAALSVAATPTPTPQAHKHKHKPAKKAARRQGPTKAQRAALTAAQAELRRQGYTTLDSAHYVYTASLRVLVGRPVGDAAGGSYAFFFLGERYLGRDSSSPSTKLRVVKAGRTMLTLEYGTYAAGDKVPSGRAKVRFKLVGEQVRPLDAIPLSRFVRGAA